MVSDAALYEMAFPLLFFHNVVNVSIVSIDINE